jgi:CHAD domain-containing protein
MPKSAFKRKFRQNLKGVNKRLKAYMEDPDDEKNIHDIRVSIRKLDAMFSLLPKKARRRYKARIKKYVELLKANSNARDCDIISVRLAALDSPATADLQDKKKMELAKAAVLARSLKKLPVELAGTQDDKRVDKIAGRLVGRIKGRLPLVLSDGNRVDELHMLRRDLRKLRYIFDIVPAGSKKMYMRKSAGAAGKNVAPKELQDLLGSIHDCDITIAYLNGRADSKQLLEREIGNRKQLYQKFVRYMKKWSLAYYRQLL